MDCPACHVANANDAIACAACGRSLQSRPSPQRSGSRRRNGEGSEAAADSTNPAAWRAYRVAIWSQVPGLGLLQGPLAVVLGCLAVRGAGDDLSASNRAKFAVLFGSLVTITQWLGVTLIWYGS
jgi:hypothetical protein